MDFIVILQMRTEDWVVFQEEQLSKKRKQDEGLLQLEKTNNEDDQFEDAWGGQTPCVFGRPIKKRKLSAKKIINFVKWKLSNSFAMIWK